jgi:hypothetical protein
MAVVRDWKTAVAGADRTVFKHAEPAAAVVAKPAAPSQAAYVAVEKKASGAGRMIVLSLALLTVIAAGAFGGWYYVNSGSMIETKNVDLIKPDGPTLDKSNETVTAEATQKTKSKEPVKTEDTKVAAVTPEPAKPIVPPPEKAKETSVAKIEPPKPPPAPPTKASTVAEISSVISGFDGGYCLLVGSAAVTESNADVLVYGSNPALFEKFYGYLVEHLTFDPNLRLQQIAPPQCVVLAAVKQLTSSNSQVLAISTDRQSLKAGNLEKGIRGDQLKATISGVRGRQLAVYLVADSGKIQNLAVTCSKCFTRLSDDETSLTVVVNAQTTGLEGTVSDKRPYLLLAVASPTPLEVQGLQADDTATQVIPALIQAIKPGSDTVAALEYFKLENAGK